MPSLGSSGSCVSEELAVELDELLVLLEELPDGGSGAELDALLPANWMAVQVFRRRCIPPKVPLPA